LVTTVLELGEEDATKHWQRLNAKKFNSNKQLEQLKLQIQKQLDKLHEKGNIIRKLGSFTSVS